MVAGAGIGLLCFTPLADAAAATSGGEWGVVEEQLQRRGELFNNDEEGRRIDVRSIAIDRSLMIGLAGLIGWCGVDVARLVTTRGATAAARCTSNRCSEAAPQPIATRGPAIRACSSSWKRAKRAVRSWAAAAGGGRLRCAHGQDGGGAARWDNPAQKEKGMQ